MIALVGLQRMPNIIPILQKGGNYRYLWLIRSTDADKSGSPLAEAWHNTMDVLDGLLEIRSGEPAVSAYGISEVQRIVAELLNGEPARFIVNFTGGTKCMSIGAYLAAQQVGCTALYVDTANEKLVWFYSNGEVGEEEFDLAGRLTVRRYLQAYGKHVDEEWTQKCALSEQALAVGRILVRLWPDCADTLGVFHQKINAKSIISRAEVDDKVAAVFKEHNFISETSGGWRATDQGQFFLTGGWLEAVVYVLFLDSQYFDDVQAGLQLRGVRNELDVVVVHKGQLAIIECKSGKLAGEAGQAALNKLQAIRTGVGTFARTFFVSNRKSNEIEDTFRTRAQEHGVRQIITAEDLLQIPDIVK
jgi:hypothetical protein